MSPTVLNQRLRELRDAGVVELADSGGYALSKSGSTLLESLAALQHWSEQRQKRLAALEQSAPAPMRKAKRAPNPR